MVAVIFHPYGWKSSVTIRCFPSVIYAHYIRYFPSVQTENSELLPLISIHTDGNQVY